MGENREPQSAAKPDADIAGYMKKNAEYQKFVANYKIRSVLSFGAIIASVFVLAFLFICMITSSKYYYPILFACSAVETVIVAITQGRRLKQLKAEYDGNMQNYTAGLVSEFVNGLKGKQRDKP
jgi:hypothetical protein